MSRVRGVLGDAGRSRDDDEGPREDAAGVGGAAESPLRAARREAERAFAPTAFGARKEKGAVKAAQTVDEDSMSDADCAKMFDKFNAYSQPETPMYQNSYETRAFLESEVKSNRMMDSPGGGMSEDSAYGSPENRGKVSKARGGGLGGLASFALGTAVAALATMGLNTTRGDALKRATFDRAKDASRGVQAMARKTSSAVEMPWIRSARRADGAHVRSSTHETCAEERRDRLHDRSIRSRRHERYRACARAKLPLEAERRHRPRVNLSLFYKQTKVRVQVSLRRRRSKSLIINITTLESEFAARNARRERVLLRLKASMVSSRE